MNEDQGCCIWILTNISIPQVYPGCEDFLAVLRDYDPIYMCYRYDESQEEVFVQSQINGLLILGKPISKYALELFLDDFFTRGLSTIPRQLRNYLCSKGEWEGIAQPNGCFWEWGKFPE